MRACAARRACAACNRYREYLRVGKGRDMGFAAILGFASKLSRGTAQMSTSRQSYRLGVRLSFGRLLGFYYVSSAARGSRPRPRRAHCADAPISRVRRALLRVARRTSATI